MFEPAYEPLNPVSHPVGFPVKGTASFIITLPWDSNMDAMTYEIVPDPLGTIAFISDETLGTIPWPPTMESFDRTTLHEIKEPCCLVGFTRSKGYRYRFALSFRPDVDFGREPTSTTAKSLFCLPPFFAPAACWWALTTVVSMK